MTRAKAVGGAAYFDGTSVNLIPVLQWGNLVGSAPPGLTYPGWVTLNATHDVAISLTKVTGRHTLKAGVYNIRLQAAEYRAGRGRRRQRVPRHHQLRQQHE